MEDILGCECILLMKNRAYFSLLFTKVAKTSTTRLASNFAVTIAEMGAVLADRAFS